MDVHYHRHFFDGDKELNFHLDQPLTREAGIATAVRLYNSEKLAYNPYALNMRTPTGEDKAILASAEAQKQAILTNTDTMKCKGTAYYVSNTGNDSNDGLSPQAAWATLEAVNSANLAAGDGVYFERAVPGGDSYGLRKVLSIRLTGKVQNPIYMLLRKTVQILINGLY